MKATTSDNILEKETTEIKREGEFPLQGCSCVYKRKSDDIQKHTAFKIISQPPGRVLSSLILENKQISALKSQWTSLKQNKNF